MPEEEVAAAAMPKGSCVIYTGHTMHGAGANTTDDTARVAMNFDYVSRFLKAECNMALENPPEIAQFYPDELLELAGWRSHAEVSLKRLLDE
jgi:ectoine hydroxylase-related dioxygenase (phytanoyl-CoA dioxygenase family)